MSWLFIAYGVVWIAIFLYVFTLDRKQRELSREFDALRSRIGKSG